MWNERAKLAVGIQITKYIFLKLWLLEVVVVCLVGGLEGTGRTFRLRSFFNSLPSSSLLKFMDHGTS